MYRSVNHEKWHHAQPYPLRKRTRRNQICILLSFAAFLMVCRALGSRSGDSEATVDDDIAKQPIMSRVSSRDLRQREPPHKRNSPERIGNTVGNTAVKDRSSPAKIETEQIPLDNIIDAHDSKQQGRVVEESIVKPGPLHVESSGDRATRLITNPSDQPSENITPDEPDDEEEPSLKGMAVAALGKKKPTAGQVSDIPPQPAITLPENNYHFSKKKEDFFPTHAEYMTLDGQADTLPDVIHFPFEDSTTDVTLQGWEDQWFSDVIFDSSRWGTLQEPKIDFIYTWVNGSDKAFQDTIAPYEVNSTLNDPEGKWLKSHRTNRYRDWDELRYSIRTVEKFAKTFRNKIQILVNAVGPEGAAATATPDKPSQITGKQKPQWMDFSNQETLDNVEILSQEEFFSPLEQGCLPTFNSLTIENQIFNTKSNVDRFFALSDDMLLGKPHTGADLYSPLFGPSMGFKTNAYNTRDPPTDLDARRFGEKPYLIYTSWLLNRRFGDRKRKGQIHFGHSMSRSVTREAINSFPRPALQSSCQRFRGETGFQLYSWYVAFHYTIERQREALLWSYIMLRTDGNQDGNIDWSERQLVMRDLEEGMSNEANTAFRDRIFYQVPELLESAGLSPPTVNVDILWTSLDGPAAVRDTECHEFNVNECMAPGFSTSTSDENVANPVFSSAVIFDRLVRQHPKCGDCLIKLILNRVRRGYSPFLPPVDTMPEKRATVIKALLKYQYSIIEADALFVMVTDADQVKHVLLKRLLQRRQQVGQVCLNDDVTTEDEVEIRNLRRNMLKFFKGIAPEKSKFEL